MAQSIGIDADRLFVLVSAIGSGLAALGGAYAAAQGKRPSTTAAQQQRDHSEKQTTALMTMLGVRSHSASGLTKVMFEQ